MTATAGDVERCAREFRLALPRHPLAGPAGRLAGAQQGSSLDFQDFRRYYPGDDVRHVDWSIYARTDQLMVRLYREEVSPDLEVVLDASRSMASVPAKAGLALALTRLFLRLAEKEHGPARLHLAGDRIERVPSGHALKTLDDSHFQGRVPLNEALMERRLRFRRRSVRVVVSDFLFPHRPDRLIGQIAEGASAAFVVQVLASSEKEPEFRGGHQLVDVESGQGVNVQVDGGAVAGYRRRLAALVEGLAERCRLWRIPFAQVCEAPLRSVCRDELIRSGVLAAA